jgi:hypothetical protein
LNAQATSAHGAHRPLAAWVLPGLGHLVLGERARGLVIMLTVVLLYLAGLLIGGIDVIDRREDQLWYAGQILAGPITIALDMQNQKLKTRATARLEDRAFPEAQPPDFAALPYIRSVGRVNELGTLYCALAGMLNLLVIVDIAFRLDPRRPRPGPRGPSGGYLAERRSLS